MLVARLLENGRHPGWTGRPGRDTMCNAAVKPRRPGPGVRHAARVGSSGVNYAVATWISPDFLEDRVLRNCPQGKFCAVT